MPDLPADCRAALDQLLAGLPASTLARATSRLSERYRAGGAPPTPHLHDDAAAAAYAAYRMPATFAAVAAALDQVRGLAPRTLLDLGGGTGSALWAAARTWPSLARAVVVEAAPPVLDLGRRLASGSATAVVRDAEWRAGDVGAAEIDADVVTLSYVLGELADRPRAHLLERLGASGAALVVVEPGTPEGYRRVLEARAALIASGRPVLAPCPHDLACPMSGSDWCHMAVRLDRSRVHRAAKGVELGYEDEKFSYVVAGPPALAPAQVDRPEGRIVRHPLIRKGLVQLQVCSVPPAIETVPVPKSRGADYRSARDIHWGDPWPPPDR